MAFEFGYFNEYSDPVTKGDPVIAAVAKVITPGIYEGALFQSMGPVSVPITSKTLEIYSRGQTSRDGVIQEVRKREHYEKPSVKRKKKSEAARKRKYK